MTSYLREYQDCADECDDAADDFRDDIGLFAARKQLSGDDTGRIDEDCAQHEQECARLEQALRDLLEVVHTGVLSA